MNTIQHDETLASLHFMRGQILFEYNEGKTIARKCLSPDAVRHALLLREFDSGWISPHTIRHGEGSNGPWVIQHYPAQSYTLLFDTPIDGHPLPPVSSIQIPLPSFLFIGEQRKYHIFAIRTWNHDRTTLYHAPVPNVSLDGTICYGDATPPIASPTTIEQAWRLFWSSRFNGDHAGDKSRKYPENILFQLHDIAQQQSTTYPGTDLIRARTTMKEILSATPRHT